jgi:hypothetical protein
MLVSVEAGVVHGESLKLQAASFKRRAGCAS